ncbi:MAG: PDZ domain-containing protein [Steroidobacteraceae bacterium]
MNRSIVLASSAILVAGAAAVSCRPTLALADPPAATDSAQHAADSARRESDEANLEAQLEAARKQLEAAAHQVAELTAQLSRPVIEGFKDFDWEMSDDHGHAIIGVQLDPQASGPGARVRGVSPGGPAAEAGIRAGDVIVAVNGTAVKGDNPARQVMRLMRDVKPDSKVSVRVQREGSTRDFSVTARSGPNFLFAHEGFPPPGAELLPGMRGPLLLQRPFMDMELATLTPQLGRYFGSEKGVLVVRAPAGGALKLEDGDVIVAIDGREPTSGSHATRILASYQPGEKVTLRIVRLHKTLDIETTLPERSGERHAAAHDDHVRAVAPLPARTLIMRDQT